MQPKSTLQILASFLHRLLVIAVLFSVLSAQAQNSGTPLLQKTKMSQSAMQEAKMLRINGGPVSANSVVDPGGIVPQTRPSVNRAEAVCATFTGALGTGDLTMSPRLYRGGVTTGSCTVAYPFPGTSGTGPYYYDLITYTNTTGLTQCGTFTLSSTDAVNANIQFAIYNGTFNPASLSTNYLADPGSSSGTPANPLTLQVNVASGQTLNIIVFSANVNTGASGTASNYTLTVDFPLCSSAACTGTPAPGNTVSSVTTVCPNINFNLSLQNSTAGAGVTYQWQSSPDGTTWTDISGATNPTLTRTQTAATYYRCKVTCSGNTGISNPVLVALTPATGCYCTPGATDCSLDDVILNVTLNTLNNTSTCTSGGYTYYSAVAAPEVYIGASNPMSVQVGPGGTEYVGVWIDYNKDGSYDASEFTALGSGNGVVIRGNIVVPSTAPTGITRMRVRVRYATALTGTNACIGYTFGETEDYNVNLVACVPTRFATHPANATATCGGNATFSVTSTGTLPAYAWEYRTSATAVWQNLTNGGIVSGATTSSLTLTGVPVSWNGYQIRALLSGGCAGVDPSNAATLTVNAPVATVNPASAVICSGGSQSISLTNLLSVPQTNTYTSGTISVNIPETGTGASAATHTISINDIPVGSVITGIKVTLNVTHSWIGDVIANLKAPNGAVFNLDYALSATGGAAPSTGFTNTVISSTGTALLSSGSSPFTGTFRADAIYGTVPAGYPPFGPVGYIPTTNAWSGLYSTPNGNWTLALYDYWVDPDPGRLTNWKLDITYVAPNYAQGIWTSNPATPNTIFNDAALTQAYTGTAQTTVYVNPQVNTVYSVSFTNPANSCVSAVTNVPVSVGVPIAGLTAPATVATCTGSGFSIAAAHTAVPATNVAPVYQWQVSTDGGVNWTNIASANATTLTVPTSAVSMNGYRYRIAVQSSACAVAYSTPTVLTVYSLPSVSLTAPATSLTPGKTITITGASSPAASTWTWALNGATIAGATNTQVATVDGLGTYQATVRDVNGCVNTSNKLTITAEASDKLWIYPNPTSGAFQIRYYHAGDVNEKRIISVYNAAGQLVATKTFNLSYNSAPYLRMDVDLSGAARGTYAVKVAHAYSGKIVSGLVLVQ